MKVLGICHDVLICSAAVVENGEVRSAIAEERLDRQKRSRVFPDLAIQRCLEDAGLELSDIDEIAVGWNPSVELETIPAGYLQARRWRAEHLMQVPGRLAHLAGGTPSSMMTVSGAAEGCPPITFIDHYDAHVGAGYFMSPFDEAAILILDGRGEKQTGLLAAGHGAEIERFKDVVFPHSLGLFYGAITEYLGFRPDSDEWKVMALASFADPENTILQQFDSIVTVDEDGGFHLSLEDFEYYNFWDRRLFSDSLVERLGPPRRPDDPIDPRHEEIAAAAQAVFERAVAAILDHLHRRTGLENLVLGGGCFMNSVFNGKTTDLTPFRRVYVGSCPDDSGTSVGAAMYLEAIRSRSKPPAGPGHNYWGPGYTDEECLTAAERSKIPNVEMVEDPSVTAAQDLANGDIVGWFQGRMEFGQRALGNRSILLDPRRRDGKEVVNQAVKYRETFRPFAPAILRDEVSDWFECDEEAEVPYMEMVLPFKKDRASEVPAVVHVDGTGRLQTVDATTNPRFYRLIEEFAALTGVPLVLNTSFNLNGEPIVCAPEDALRTFYACALDVLYLGSVRITKHAPAGG